MNWFRTLVARPIVLRAVRLCAVVLVCAALANPAFGRHEGHHGEHHGSHHSGSQGGSNGGGGSAPEIDPTALTGALALLGGGALVLSDRLRKK